MDTKRVKCSYKKYWQIGLNSPSNKAIINFVVKSAVFRNLFNL